VSVITEETENARSAPVEPRPARRPSPPIERTVGLAISAVIVLYSFLQEPGRIIADTKLDLYVAPSEFLRRALHLWDGQAGFGQIQNQAPGYLFPMGPFFAITHALHIPTWVAQRVWIAGLLLLAFWGTIKLAQALKIGTSWTRLVAAAAYALSPAVLSLIASTSWAELPAALLPWVLLPLVRHQPSQRASRTAAKSALVVAAMGGVNGMATAAVLVMPFMWLLTRPPGRERRSLIVWWVPCVGLATAWWVGPLFLQAKYGFHFLDFTETAAVTTGTSSIAETVRGTGYWVSYLHISGPWLRGAWAFVASPLIILSSAFLAAAGLYGLARKDLPHRRFLAWTAVVGVLILTAGYAGPLSSQLAPSIQSLLKGPLSPARNLNKFEPILRLALVLALAHAIVVLDVSSLVRRTVTCALLVVLAAAPMWQGQLASEGSFRALPSYWRQAAQWLGDRASKGRTLIVPSAAFGEYTWGRPLDEPMQALAQSDWAVRDIVPLGSVGEARLLDTIERPLELGEPSPGLAAYMARAGIHYVLLRNDLDPLRSGAPAPAYVRRSLDGSPGLVPVKSFGPKVNYVMGADRQVPDLGRSVRGDVHSLEVYELYSPPTTIATYPVANAMSVSGAPDSLLQLADAGALNGRAAVLTGDPLGGKAPDALQVQSDAVQRRDDQFGWVRNNLSYPLTPSEHAPGTDQQPQQRLIVGGTGAEASARMTGAVAIDASSYDGALARSPEHQPYAAFDGDPDTAWVTGVPNYPVGEWIQLRVAKPISPRTIDVRLLLDRQLRPRITSLRITTAAGSVTRTLQATEAPQTLVLPRGATTWVRLTIAGVKAGGGGAGLREIQIPDVNVDRTLALPKPATSAAGPNQEVLLTRGHADPYDRLHSDEEPSLDRIFSVPAATQLQLSGTVQPVPGSELDNLLAAVAPPSSLQIVPSSTWGNIPAFGAGALVDGDVATSWLASPEDRQPSIKLSWPGERAIDSIQITPPDGPAIRPLKVRLQSGLAVRDIDVSSGKLVPFEPLHGDQVTVTFLDATPTAAGQKTPGFITPLSDGIAELRFPALDDLRSAQTTGTVAIPCGEGPAVTVDGTTVSTAVEGTLNDLETLSPLSVSACGEPLRLAAGEHRLTSGAQGGLVLTTAALVPRPAAAATQTASARSAAIDGTWGRESREVRVGAGPASYLALTENFNKGWTASLNGHQLQAVRLDGWRQAWVVPAGAGGIVHLSFPPGHVYIWVLVAGIAFIVVLLELAWWPGSHRSRSTRRNDLVYRASRVPYAAQVAAAAAVSFLLGGIVGVLVCLAMLFMPRRRALLPWVAGGAFALAGIALFLSPGQFPGSNSGAFGAPAQLFAMVAVIAVALSLVEVREARRAA
jgi:arabinofuranan 3-O-arabinosyltransferase